MVIGGRGIILLLTIATRRGARGRRVIAGVLWLSVSILRTSLINSAIGLLFRVKLRLAVSPIIITRGSSRLLVLGVRPRLGTVLPRGILGASVSLVLTVFPATLSSSLLLFPLPRFFLALPLLLLPFVLIIAPVFLGLITAPAGLFVPSAAVICVLVTGIVLPIATRRARGRPMSISAHFRRGALC